MSGPFLTDREYIELAHATICGPLHGTLPRDNTTVVAAALEHWPVLRGLSDGVLAEFCTDFFFAVAAVRCEQRYSGLPA